MIIEIIDAPAAYSDTASPAAAVAPLTPVWPNSWAPYVTLPDDASADLGGVIRARPQHLGSGIPYVDVFPVIEIHVGDRLQISLDDGIKYQAWKAGPFSLGPVLEYREAFRDKLAVGAPTMPDAFEGGGYAQWKTPVGDLETRLRRALSSYQGWSTSTAFDTGGYVTPRLGIGLELRGEWIDPRYTRSFLDIHPQYDPLFAYPHFGPDDYSTLGAQLTLGYRLTPRLTAFTQSSFDRVFGEAWTRPVLHTRNIAITSLGLTWHLGPIVPFGKLPDGP